MGRPKACYYQPKNQQFEEKNQQENLIAIFLSAINLDEHVSTKIDAFRIYQGVWGASPQKQIFLKKSNKMEAFPYLIFAFLARLPKSPKLWARSLAPLK